MTTIADLREVAEVTDPAARELISRFIESELTILEARISQLKQVQEALREASD